MPMCTTYMLGVLYHCVLKYVLKQLVGIILNGAFFFLLLLHFNKIGFEKLQAQNNFHVIEIMLKGQNCSSKRTLTHGAVYVQYMLRRRNSTRAKPSAITYLSFGNTGCGVFKRGYKIRKTLAYESTYSKIFFWILRIGLMESFSSLKKFWQQKYWKNEIVNFKNSDFCSYCGSLLVQFSKFKKILWVCWFVGENLCDFIPPFKNSTTRIAII